ncbi:plancitoxin-1 [Asbolus verrucosus]|uniref:Plancitoxin-1 n=1 Tax=Asbolus verrucosus TaxID=1661398 RepID=A0A482V7G6_ASBVE|nr:plancitoxin-1 [Asbolus verrucosus]
MKQWIDGEKLIKNGLGYAYITSTDYTKWEFSNYSINDTNSILGNTLVPFYKNLSDTGYVLYNDQPPTELPKSSKGHTKGVVLTDLNGGFWLIHSVPHFPQLGANYTFSSSGVIKGQSFFCISLDLKNLNKVGIQLQYNEPQIYASHVPDILKSKISQIEAAVSGVTVTQPPWFNQIPITSKSGIRFISFAKSKKFGKDLYEDWVAPALQSNLLVETWPNGAGKLPSNCSKPFKVYNVETVSMKVTNTTFSNTQDHSKWAVSQNLNWICIGDINRMEHQKVRGGGTVCLNNEMLSTNYRDCVVAIEKCHN